jgi:hypothetical protein
MDMDTTNEPVAWMDEETGCFVYSQYDYEDLDEHGKDGLIPLYTHPVNPKYDPETGEPLIDGYPLFSGLPHPVKELTDEEILEAWQEAKHTALNTKGNFVEVLFARAILRKAQEK